MLEMVSMASDSTPNSGACVEAVMLSELGRNLLGLVPSLRAFAFCLSRNELEADDLVYRSLPKIWSEHRKKKGLELRIAAFTVIDRQYRAAMLAPPSMPPPAVRSRSEEAEPFSATFESLDSNEREALSLVVVWAFSYEQAAVICSTDARMIERRVIDACFRLKPTLRNRTPADSLV